MEERRKHWQQMEQQMMDLTILTARHEERLADLEDCRRRQNGTMQRLEQKLDQLIMWMMTAAITGLGALVVTVIGWIMAAPNGGV